MNITTKEQTENMIEIQIKLLKQWCNNNGWTEVHVSSDYQFYAFPPDSYIASQLPKEAFTQLERLGDIFQELREVKRLRLLIQDSKKSALILVLTYAFIFSLRVLIEEKTNNSIFLAVVSISDILLTFCLIDLLALINFTIFRLWKYQKLQYKLAKNITTDSSVSLKILKNVC